jgi:hypothetical protein
MELDCLKNASNIRFVNPWYTSYPGPAGENLEIKEKLLM